MKDDMSQNSGVGRIKSHFSSLMLTLYSNSPLPPLHSFFIIQLQLHLPQQLLRQQILQMFQT